MDSKTKSRLLAIRSHMKTHQPAFNRPESWRLVRIKKSWRKMHGIDNKTRMHRKQGVAEPDTGYRSPKDVKYLHPTGLQDVLVTHESDLKGLSPKVHGIRISGKLGIKKKLALIEKVREAGFRILNMGISKKEIMEIEKKEEPAKEKLSSKQAQIQKKKEEKSKGGEKASDKVEEKDLTKPADEDKKE